MRALPALHVPPPRPTHLRVVGEDYEPRPKGTAEEAHEHLKVISRQYNALTARERMRVQADLPGYDVYRWILPGEWEIHYWIAKAFYAAWGADRTRFAEEHLTPRCALAAVLADRFGDKDGRFLMGSPDLKRIIAEYAF